MLFIILPAYNEEGAIGALLEYLKKTLEGPRLEYTILLVNDGSSDGTLKEASAYLSRMPLKILDHGVNKGVHEAFRTGFSAACEAARDDDVIFTMDADGTHDARLIPQMASLVAKGYDIVITSRFRPGSRIYGVPLYRNFLSYAARYIVPFIFGEKEARDFTIFHRAYRARVLKELLGHYKERFIETHGFTSNTEVLVKARRHFGERLKIIEIPCELHYERKKGPSKMKVMRNIREYFRFIWMMKAGKID